MREIFDAALRRRPEERRRFVNEACCDDKSLLAEVESLLASHDSAESFMETPAVARVAQMIEPATSKLEKGSSFGHYEIVEQIGAGGMGEVYLAKDAKLDRKVAIKILNEEFSRHESNLTRFIREAKATSSLNHPNILVVHEIGEYENTNYIVAFEWMEKAIEERDADSVFLKRYVEAGAGVYFGENFSTDSRYEDILCRAGLPKHEIAARQPNEFLRRAKRPIRELG